MGRIVTKLAIESYARLLGVNVETSAPGDGIRRYEFFCMQDGRRGRTFARCAGGAKAYAFLQGFEEGMRRAKYKEAK